MTRTEYLEQKRDIEERMSQTRRDERKELAEVNVKYDEDVSALKERYKRDLQELAGRKANKRILIEEHYKEIRRKISYQDWLLVDTWRAQLKQEGGEE